MKNTIGENIRLLRVLRGLSQENMANELDISVSAYSNIERDVSELTVSRLILIAGILKVKASTILEMNGKYILAENEEKGYQKNSLESEFEKLKKQFDTMATELKQLKTPSKKTTTKTRKR